MHVSLVHLHEYFRELHTTTLFTLKQHRVSAGHINLELVHIAVLRILMKAAAV